MSNYVVFMYFNTINIFFKYIQSKYRAKSKIIIPKYIFTIFASFAWKCCIATDY